MEVQCPTDIIQGVSAGLETKVVKVIIVLIEEEEAMVVEVSMKSSRTKVSRCWLRS